MDKSLDEVIKENPRKFSRNHRRNNGVVQKKKNNSPLLTGVTKNNTGRVTKKQQSQGGKGRLTGKKSVRTGVKPINNGKVIVDVRNKLLAKNRMKIVDARDKLAAITKKTTSDLRLKLSSKKPQVHGRVNKGQGGRLKLAGTQGVKPLMRELGNHSLTRTILGRTVENELARFSGHSMSQSPSVHHAPPLRYEPPPQPQYYSYHQSSVGYDFNRSTAAMDCDPPPSASQRIRTTSFVGAGSSLKSPVKTELGHRVYVSNLHPKVTEEDIGELFGDVGVLLRATLQRPGVAEIVYQRHEDAQRAVEIYHNRQLDGLPMHCSLGPYVEMSSRRDVAPPPSSSSKPSMYSSRSIKRTY